jgi:hypothetical protein
MSPSPNSSSTSGSGGASSNPAASIGQKASKQVGKAVQSIGGHQITGYSGPGAVPYSYHKGGKVKKGGRALLKKGELVLTKSQQRKRLKKKGGKHK